MMEKAQVTHAFCDFRLRDELDLACVGIVGVRTLYFNGGAAREDSLEQLMEG